MSGQGSEPEVVLYTRERCGLCRQAEQFLREHVPEERIVLRDIDEDDELLRRFHLRVPVIEVDGTIVAEAPIDPAAVRRALRVRSRRRRWFHTGPRGS